MRPAPARETANAAPPPTRRSGAASDEAKRRAQELLKRRLGAPRAAGASSPSPTPPRTTVETAASAPATKEQLTRELAVSLKMASRVTGSIDRGSRYALEARSCYARGKLDDAVKQFRLAVALAPDDAGLRAEYERAARELAASLADTYLKQAEYEEQHQKWSAAAISWMKVVAGRPEDARSHWRCAHALLASSGDVKRAVQLAKRAVELEPEGLLGIRTLGRAYLAAGMTLNARRELARALEIAPHDTVVKDLLRELDES